MTYQELYLKYKLKAEELGKEDTAIKVLILELGHLDKTAFYTRYRDEVDTKLLEIIIKGIELYLYQNTPIQYIIGHTYFYGLKLKVTSDVLIPRPETELLVEYIINYSNIKKFKKVLDIGTGSGAISLSLKNELKYLDVTAVDISKEALLVASSNAKTHNLDINFLESDVFSNIKQKYDVIVSNPPYIDKDGYVEEIVEENEPHLALFASEKGLFFYNKILKESQSYLEDDFLIAFEIPEDKDEELINIVDLYYPLSYYEIIKDLNNLSRILIITSERRSDF